MTARQLSEYKNRVADLGCIVEGCGAPALLHHPRFCVGMAQRSSDWLVIPLCPSHHQHGGHGTAIHAGQATFELNHGSEAELLAKVIQRMDYRSGG
jgi:hypothetical protein